jgi:hypothetical protein
MKLALATAALGLAVAATPAGAAVTVNPNGTVGLDHNLGTNAFTVYFGGPAGTAASLLLTLTGGSGNSYNFTYSFNNTGTAAKLVGFAFDTDPTLASVTSPLGDPLKFGANANFPGVGTVDACFYSGNNCGAANGQATSFNGGFTLNFNSGPVTLSNFVDRYASIGGSGGPSGEGSGTVFHPAVPEPATWAMMLVGFGGIGVSMRRRRKADGRLLQIA